MPIPMFPQQPMTVDDVVRRMMQNPAIAAKVRRDPKFASKLVAKVEQQMRSFVRAPSSDRQAVQMRRRAPIGTTLGAPIAEGTTSVADMVRVQRDGFLMADGSQVAGDYTTVIRAEKGGIAAPRMPPVGFPAAQSYHYPSRKMITGAALAATPMAADFTNARRPLPTGSFNPEFFVASRPDQQGNNLITNRPMRVPSVRDQYPSGSMFAEPQSPSEERRRNLSVLMGLPPMPSVRPTPVASFNARARFLRRRSLNGLFDGKYVPNYQFSTGSTRGDAWWIIREALQQADLELGDKRKDGSVGVLEGLVKWADPLVIPVPVPTKPDGSLYDFSALATDAQGVPLGLPKGNPAFSYVQYLQKKKIYENAKCISFTPKDFGLCALEASKALARGIIVANILSDTIDLSAVKLPDGKNGNDWVNENIANWVPSEYRSLVQGFKLMPLDLTQIPMRRFFIEKAYEEIWKEPIKDEWFEAISNELRNAKSGSLGQAVAFLRNSKYAPNAKKPPVVKLLSGAMPISEAMNGRVVSDEKAADKKTSTGTTTDVGADTVILAAGGIAAVALVGLGIYFRNK